MTIQLPDIAMLALNSLAGDGHHTVTELASALDINTRYAREVSGLLLHNKLAEIVEDEDGDRYRITPAGREYLTGGQPRDLIVESGNRTEGRPAMVKNESKIEFKKCGCGCGEDIGGKSTFKQGHDARMVSQLTAAVVGSGKGNAIVPPAFTAAQVKAATGPQDIQARIDATHGAVKFHFGDKLADKFHSAAMNGWAKYDKPERAPRKAKAKAVTVKVGRWEKVGTIDPTTGDFTDAKTGKVTPAGKYKAA